MGRTLLCNKGHGVRVAYPRTIEVFPAAQFQALITDVEEHTLSLQRSLNLTGRYYVFSEGLLVRLLFQREEGLPGNCTSFQTDV